MESLEELALTIRMKKNVIKRFEIEIEALYAQAEMKKIQKDQSVLKLIDAEKMFRAKERSLNGDTETKE